MSVGRTEITDVQTREDIARLLAEHRLEVVVAAKPSLPFMLIYKVHLLRQLVQSPPPFVIGRTGRQIHEILRDTALERINRHVVVIEHDQQVVLVHRGVVQSLKSQTACHRSIAYDGYGIMRGRYISLCSVRRSRSVFCQA